jgi:hypothetical protein
MVQWSVRAPRPILAAALLTLLGLGSPSAVRADVISFTNTGAGEFVNVTLNGQDLHGWAGQYVMSLNGGSPFNAFCVDLADQMGLGATYNVNATTMPPFVAAPLGNQIASVINKYVNSPSAAAAFLGISDQNIAEAAAQLAVWALEYGSAFSYSPDAGGPTQAQVDAFVNAALSSDQAGFTSTVYQRAEGDQIGQTVATGGTSPGPTPVPEPPAVVLLGMGLLGLGLAFGRRPVFALAA